MRRALYLIAVLLAGAARAAVAQSHVRLTARLGSAPAGSAPNLVVHLSDLLDDPEWRAELEGASIIRVHWSATLYRSSFPFDIPRPPVEWEDDFSEVPVVNQFQFVERTARGPKSFKFGTLDSLRVVSEQEISVPTPVTIGNGKWYYSVTATITAVNEERNAATAGWQGFLQRLVLGSGRRLVLTVPSTVTFVVKR
jgi:hypothetical protein